MYQKNYKSARALVYKGFSKFVGLDKKRTKAINLPEPFVSKNGQRIYPNRKAPENLPDPCDFTSKSSSFTPYPPFLKWKKFIFGLALATRCQLKMNNYKLKIGLPDESLR